MSLHHFLDPDRGDALYLARGDYRVGRDRSHRYLVSLPQLKDLVRYDHRLADDDLRSAELLADPLYHLGTRVHAALSLADEVRDQLEILEAGRGVREGGGSRGGLLLLVLLLGWSQETTQGVRRVIESLWHLSFATL